MEDGRSRRLARVRALWPPTPYQEHGPVVVLFKLVDQFQVQEGERPKLRGQDATQLIVFKISAIGGWSGRQIRGQASGLSLSAAALPALSLYPAAVREGWSRGAVAHISSSTVSAPSCVGRLPLKPFFSSCLREGRRSEWKHGWKAVSGARKSLARTNPIVL